jgi:hypothetical protein
MKTPKYLVTIPNPASIKKPLPTLDGLVPARADEGTFRAPAASMRNPAAYASQPAAFWV